MEILETYREEIFKLCENHKVKELYVFGSVLNDNFNESSDIDLLIQFDTIDVIDYFDNYMDLKEHLEELFHRDIDLLEHQTIRNPILKNSIDKEKKLLYERKSA